MLPRPVRAAFRLDGRHGPVDCFEYALECVDAVHGDGKLPEIVGAAKAFNDEDSKGYDNLLGYLDLPQRALWINLNGDMPEFTVLHEIGHVIDHWGLGNGPSVVATAPELEEWRDAIFRTSAWRRLYETATIRGYTFADPVHGLTLKADEGDSKHARYLLQWAELWARSYAQYVVTASRRARIVIQLNGTRDSAYGRFYGAHWTDADFAVVTVAMDRLMASKGWKQNA